MRRDNSLASKSKNMNTHVWRERNCIFEYKEALDSVSRKHPCDGKTNDW